MHSKCAIFVLLAAWTCQADEIRFNRDIRPILSDKCYKCHGPSARKPKAGLRLNQRESAVRKRDGDPPAITPGNAEKSVLVSRINSKDPDELMPPPDSGKSLTKAQKDILARWIKDGIWLPLLKRPGVWWYDTVSTSSCGKFHFSTNQAPTWA